MNDKNKSYATNAYILNVAEVYKGCELPNRRFLHTRPEPVYAVNCEPRINYNCQMPNDIKCWKEPIFRNASPSTTSEATVTTDIVRSNIERGGIICDFKPRTTINTKMSSRFLTDFVRPPCDYVQDVETEFYLIHGTNSSCSKYWKNRHIKNN
jgi:hypothetical protein